MSKRISQTFCSLCFSLLTNRALVSSGQVLIQEEGKEDIVWETQSFSSYLTSWEFLLFLVNPEHTSVRAPFLPET